jgi:hypothetical protein
MKLASGSAPMPRINSDRFAGAAEGWFLKHKIYWIVENTA